LQRESFWGVAHSGGIAPIAGTFGTTAALIENGESHWRAAAAQAPTLPFERIALLSPVTAPARVLCQGANYRQHMIESG
jgi:2-keto-4-pentenoate hydratase/2-oxohepta-3-ene-1,7-dioic acid hydratase in catechol pathway